MTSSQLRQQAALKPELAAVDIEQYAGTQNIVSLPQAVNLTLYAGDDFYLDLTVTEPGGAAADLTGCTASSQIRATPGATTVLATMTGTIVGNVITLHLDSTDAVSLANGVWDAQLVRENGDIVTLVAGTVTVSPEVTRP